MQCRRRRVWGGILLTSSKEDGSIVTWGDTERGADISAVRGQLTRIRSIDSTCSAFAAIKDDGSVVTWGPREHGGDAADAIWGTQHDDGVVFT